MSPTDPANIEEARLRELNSLEILDSEPEADFNEIVELASSITGCPITLISLVDRRRQWFKARVGLDVAETPREISFCTHAIQNPHAYIVKDALADERFRENPLVTGEPNIRFYAGHPLITSNGHRLGTLCAIDRVPHELTPVQLRQLELLAKQTVRIMELRIEKRKLLRSRNRLSDLVRESAAAREVAQKERLNFERAFSQFTFPFAWFEGPSHRFAFVNKAYCELLHLDRPPIGLTVAEALPDSVEQGFTSLLTSIYTTGQARSGKAEVFWQTLRDGTRRQIFVDSTCAPKRNAAGEIEGVLVAVVDVTDQVTLQMALQSAQRDLLGERDLLEKVIASTPAPMVLFRGDDLVLELVNPEYQKIFPGRELAGRPLFEAQPEMRGQGFDEMLRGVMRTGQPYHGKERPTLVASSNGLETKYYNFSYVPIFEATGGIYGVLNHAIDVTDAVLNRRRLEASEERVRKYAEAMPQMAFIADARGEITYFNQTFYDYVGLRPGSMQGDTWKRHPIHHPDDLQRTIDRWAHSVATGEPYEIEYRLRRADGAYRWHLGRATAERNVQGEITEWFGTNTDIHELRQTQESLAAAEDALNVALRAAEIGFWDWNAVTGHTILSDTLMESWGIDPATFKNTLTECMERIHPDDRERIWAEIQEATFRKRRYEVEYRVVRPEGTLRLVSAKGEFFLNEKGEPVRLTGVVIDITERKRAEQELLDARVAADEASAAKSAFLANMSHEIRTPLGAIMGFADLVQQSHSLSDEAANYLSVIQRNSVQVLKIVDDILDLAKVEAGKVLIERLEVPLIDFLADFTSLMGFRARENAITFRVDARTALPDLVQVDPTRLRQVLTNVVGNAIKFTSHGIVSLDVCYRGNVLEIDVRDTGRGISPEQAATLFQPFVQADISTTRKYGGTGLGLALTRRLCRAMGGDFVLKHSQLGVGSHFLATIEAPAASHARMLEPQDLTFSVAAPKAEKAPVSSPLRGVRVLVVEDSPDNQELLRVILEKQGASFALAHNGAEGLKRALEDSFDVVLMDVQMPVMDGHEAVAKLRAAGYAAPVIALTAHAMKEEFERAMRSGFTDYLTKPVNRGALTAMIAKHASLN